MQKEGLRAIKSAIVVPAVVLFVLAALGACTTGMPNADPGMGEQEAPAARAGQTYVYQCGEDARFTVRVEGETAWLFLDSGTLSLPRATTVSGERFSDGVSTFWNKGDEASFISADRQYSGCRNNRAQAIWEDAKFRGVDFRALGNEPGWMLEMFRSGKVVFEHDYGSERLVFSESEVVSEAASRRTRYELSDGVHRLSVVLEGRPCNDSMSGESFETSVELVFDGKALMGCGRVLH